ncbi:MAG: hypothetical protein LBV67_01735 [Streptococcaceae bacterium]|jgi:hypothetical protein|nr:hypothetical protein [Streptococcaceae bacterium]
MKKKNKQKRSIGQRIVSSILITLAPVVINYAVDKFAQARREEKVKLDENGRKDVTDSLK